MSTNTPPPFLMSYARSITSNAPLHCSNVASLATIDLQLNPSVRMVTISEVDTRTYHCVYFTTNKQASKIQELQSCQLTEQPVETNNISTTCELCHYFPISREQYRMRCKVRIIDSNSTGQSQLARKKIWDASPNWLSLNKYSQTSNVTIDSSDTTSSSSQVPHEDFVVIQLLPVQCDYLKLPPPEIDRSKPLHKESQIKPSRHAVRWLHRQNSSGQWITQELNP